MQKIQRTFTSLSMATPSISWFAITRRNSQVSSTHFMLIDLTGGIISHNTSVDPNWRRGRPSRRHQFVHIGGPIHNRLANGFLRGIPVPVISGDRRIRWIFRFWIWSGSRSGEIWHSRWSHVKVSLFPINSNKLFPSSCCLGNDHI